jgi:hypothetical protein
MTTTSEVKWYSNLKVELRKYSIDVDDISKFAKVIDNIRSEYNYAAGKVIKEFSDLEILRTNHASLQMRKEIALIKTQKEDLHHDYQKILSESVHSRQAVNFLQGSVFSL